MLLKLTSEEKKKIEKNVYFVVNNSFIDRLFQEYIGLPLVSKLHFSITPNIVTLTGFFPFILCACISVHSLLMHHEVTLSTKLVPLFVAFAFFCDNLDGNLARTTGRVTLLGEVLDHGLDYVVASFQAFVAVLVYQRNSYTQVAIVLGFVQHVFIFIHTRHYLSGIMLFKSIGPFEANILFIAVTTYLSFNKNRFFFFDHLDKFFAAAVLLTVLEVYLDLKVLLKELKDKGKTQIVVALYKKTCVVSFLSFFMFTFDSTPTQTLLSFLVMTAIGFTVIFYLILMKSTDDNKGRIAKDERILTTSLLLLLNILVVKNSYSWYSGLKLFTIGLNVIEHIFLLKQLYKYKL